MVAAIWEKPKSMTGDVPFWGQSSAREFAASGCADSSALIALILANPGVVPPYDVVNNIPLFIDKYSYKEFGGGCWDVTAHYRAQKNQWKISGDTGGGTRKRFYSLGTVGAYDCTAPNEFETGEDGTVFSTVPDFNGAINVTSNGVEGVDVPDPKFDFTIQETFDMSSLAAGYLQTLYQLTGTINISPFTLNYNGQMLNFGVNELLLKSAAWTQSSTNDLDISFKFSACNSITEDDNQTIGLSSPIVASGWDYIWTFFKEFLQNYGPVHTTIKKPVAAYVEQVIFNSDFDLLGLG